MSQVTTLTLFRFDTFISKVWAFSMMQRAHSGLAGVPGQQFYKLMGSGKGAGFNPLPDWSVYALLQTWQNEECAQQFVDSGHVLQAYRKKAADTWTIFMRPIIAKGLWSGQLPFLKSETLDPENASVAIITRATIKWSKMFRFWSYVPRSQRPLKAAKGLLFTKGIGEAPLVQMATFSLWEDEKQMQAFAYGSEEHQKAIKLTRQLDWYKEELFARFQPYRSIGTWYGKNPVQNGSSMWTEPFL